jgi:hypothetical protein
MVDEKPEISVGLMVTAMVLAGAVLWVLIAKAMLWVWDWAASE